MATTSVLDVRRAVLPPRAVPTPSVAARRLPVTVAAAAAVGVVEALGLLAVGLTGLDGLLLAAERPATPVVVGALVLLAAWVVASAGGGATMVDGAGRRGYVALAYVELGAVATGGVAVAVGQVDLPLPAHLPLPAAVLLLLAVPVGKLLLAGSPSARVWIAAGPRVRERRPDPVARHRLVAAVTMAAIGLTLGAVAVGGPQPDGPGGIAATTAVTSDR